MYGLSLDIFILSGALDTLLYTVIPLPASARLGCVAAAADTLLLSLTFVCVLLSLISAFQSHFDRTMIFLLIQLLAWCPGVTCIMVVSAWRRRDLAKGMGASSLIHLVVSDGVAYFICLSSALK